jgi:ribosomal protein S18 acetylase RimI-like enzyme
MSEEIIIKEVPIEEATRVNAKIVEFGGPYGKDYFEKRYEGKDKLILVAYADGQPAGYIVAYDKFGDGSLYCWMAGVDPAFRRMGILRAMMDHQDSWAKKKGYKKIKIKTRNNRREMLAYLVKHGFLFTEVQVKSDIRDNRILLEKEI